MDRFDDLLLSLGMLEVAKLVIQKRREERRTTSGPKLALNG